MRRLSLPAKLLRGDTLLRRLLVLYAAGITAIIIAGAAVIWFAVWPHYELLERRESDHRLHAVLQAVQSEKDRLQELVNTNAVWDDPFQFVLGENPEFPAINFNPTALEQIGVDGVLIIGNDGAQLFGGGQGDYTSLLQAASSVVTARPLAGADDSQTALLTVGGDVAIFSERRIVRADGSGPSPGALIFIRRIGPPVLARMHALTGTEFVIGRDAPGARAHAELHDAYGRANIKVAVLGAHDILAVGKSTIITLVIAAAVMLAVLGALFAAALINAVIAPVSSLRRAVTAASETKTPCEAPKGAPTEIQDLAAAFDRALILAQSQTELRNAALAEKQIAEAANEAKSQFIASISHELRTPLNAVIGYGELLSESAAEEGRPRDAEDAERIVRSAQSLLNLINAILDFSKLGAGKMEAVIEPFAVKSMLGAVMEIGAPLAASKGLKLELSVADDLGGMQSDAQKLQQCLINLISNAIKFTEKGRVVLRVTRLTKDDADLVQFEVRDTGIGMDAEALQRVFEPFSQADSTISRRFGGTGLGLAITRDMVRLLGGRIGVKSKPGVGTTFVIQAPADLTARAPQRRAA